MNVTLLQFHSHLLDTRNPNKPRGKKAELRSHRHSEKEIMGHDKSCIMTRLI